MDQEPDNLSDIIDRRIPRAWRGDLRVEGVGSLAQANGFPAGTPYVDISARTKLARTQAMISIGPFAANDADQWFDCWQRREIDGVRRWVLRVYRPSVHHQHPDVFTAAE